MLKINLSLVVVLLMSVIGFSQKQFHPEWHIGIKGGISASRVYFTPRVEQEFKRGKTFGVAMTYYSDYFWHTKWGLHLEFNRTEKGWNSTLDAPESYSKSLVYTEMPIFAQSVFGYKNFKLLINFGPFVALLREESEESNFVTPAGGLPYYVSKTSDSNFDFGVGGGIGFVRPFPWGKIQVEGRVMQSLTGLYTYDVEQSLSSQNQYGEINFAVYYILNKKN